jgi:Bacterial SCP ortholog
LLSGRALIPKSDPEEPVTSSTMARSQNPALSRAALDAQLAELGSPPYTGPDTVPALRRGCLDAVLAAYDSGTEPHRVIVKAAVRFLLDLLVAAAPGKSVEVRVPPFAAVQCIEGLRHTRGTPPNVVEMDAATWIGLATGRMDWTRACDNGSIRASGSRADLSAHLPLLTGG